jgi:hypothetical protein
MELLDETGRGKDARSAFIVPQYVGQDENKKIEAFRFIKDVYNASGAQTNYNYVQSPIKYNTDGSLYVQITEQVDQFIITIIRNRLYTEIIKLNLNVTSSGE